MFSAKTFVFNQRNPRFFNGNWTRKPEARNPPINGSNILIVVDIFFCMWVMSADTWRFLYTVVWNKPLHVSRAKHKWRVSGSCYLSSTLRKTKQTERWTKYHILKNSANSAICWDRPGKIPPISYTGINCNHNDYVAIVWSVVLVRDSFLPYEFCRNVGGRSDIKEAQ